jgi:hypothetical protein
LAISDQGQETLEAQTKEEWRKEFVQRRQNILNERAEAAERHEKLAAEATELYAKMLKEEDSKLSIAPLWPGVDDLISKVKDKEPVSCDEIEATAQSLELKARFAAETAVIHCLAAEEEKAFLAYDSACLVIEEKIQTFGSNSFLWTSDQTEEINLLGSRSRVLERLWTLIWCNKGEAEERRRLLC